jgi:hypothetical protein
MKTANELSAKELVEASDSYLFRLHFAQCRTSVSAADINLELAKAGYTYRIAPTRTTTGVWFYAVFQNCGEIPVQEDICLLVDAIRAVRSLEQKT